MRYLLTLVFSILITFSYGQVCKKMYKKKLEHNTKLIDCAYNYTIEELKNGNCIFKRYYPETKAITQFITLKTDKLQVRHGLYQQRWDDGTLVNSGMYINNKKEGEWLENEHQVGQYEQDLKEGVWKHYNADSMVIAEYNYLKGELNGQHLTFDSTGQVSLTEVYKDGKLISTIADTTKNYKEIMPRFPGCEERGLSEEETKLCADKKMLAYIYKGVKYPKRARQLNIQGKAMVRFKIDKEGQVTDIKVLNGVSKGIKKVVIKLVENMPAWKPGMQYGKPVNVYFNLPVNFKLE